jgi:uncharacterized membrane protein YsdA (DUF1294 family)
MSLSKFVILWLAFINVIAFVLYGMDKKKAEKGKWRIPEADLVGVAGIGGGIGAWLGMHVFHHKTKHTKFRVLVPVFTILWAILAVGLLYQLKFNA